MISDTLARFLSKKYSGYSIEIEGSKQRFLIWDDEGELILTLTVDEVLEAFIGQKLQYDYRRKEPRINVALKSKYSVGDGTEVDAITGTIGGGGLFIESGKPLPLGSKVNFEVVLPHEPGNPVRGVGEVVWTRSSVEREIFFPGMGVQFREISTDDRSRIVQFVDAIKTSRGTLDDDEND